jgi:hypothetical protein
MIKNYFTAVASICYNIKLVAFCRPAVFYELPVEKHCCNGVVKKHACETNPRDKQQLV